MSRRRTALGAVILVLALTGCASENKTGSGEVLDFKDTVQKGLGDAASPTAARTAAPAATKATAPTAPVASKAAPAPARTAAPQRTQAARAFVITINSDSSAAGSQFTPSVARVYVGQVVTWKNGDNVARSVVEDNGAFTSPSIPPGGTYTYTADKPGTFNYKDGTRPYAVASLEVLER